MTTARQLHEGTLALLRQITGLTVYSGRVDDNPPSDRRTGLVKPYAVLWAQPGVFPDEEAGTPSDDDTGELDWEARVTVASGDPDWTLDAAVDVRAKLSRARVVPQAGRLKEPPGLEVPILQDKDVKPSRWYVPLVFNTLTA